MADGLVHCVEKGGWYPTEIKEEEDLPALRITWIDQLRDDIKKAQSKKAESNRTDNIRTNRKPTKPKKNRKGNKTIAWVFQITNWSDCEQEDLKIAMKGKPKRETESHLIAAKNNAIRPIIF